MPSLIKLPLRAAEIATAPTRFAVRTLWRMLRDGGDGGDGTTATAAPESPTAAASRPSATAAGPRPPVRKRAPARVKPSPKAARRAVRGEPTKGQAAALREKAREEEQAAGGGGPTVGATIEVAAPWEGYDGMTESQVLDRLTGADVGVRAVVRLYESMHADRRQVILATEGPSSQP